MGRRLLLAQLPGHSEHLARACCTAARAQLLSQHKTHLVSQTILRSQTSRHAAALPRSPADSKMAGHKSRMMYGTHKDKCRKWPRPGPCRVREHGKSTPVYNPTPSPTLGAGPEWTWPLT